MESLETLLELLRQNGLKVTPQRRAILELIIERDGHPTAEMLYRHIQAVMPDVSRATIYNTLRELVALGVLTEVQGLSDDGLRYDTRPGVHHHLFCTRCYAMLDVFRDFEGVRLSPEEASGYRIMKHQVTFYGLCPKCQNQADD